METVQTKHLNEQKLGEIIKKVDTAVYGDQPYVVSSMPDDFALQEALRILLRLIKKFEVHLETEYAEVYLKDTTVKTGVNLD